ncbi:hypothetical protein [Kutzneria sp. CA-103260]|uniref:hypothetical protein n=1 Tax=Kutzneria sp. CA-103260 TaxID=2802641 RepID=UPI001BA9EA35|nr:hypothetical protein [Kutzneria sp. CA-103260]QUQ70252.1 hypothetical protein JJ691_80270 [Kutzneria sp. CA-103260]
MTMRLPHGGAPRGLCPNGMVRTTGWLQIGRTPISSGLWAVLAGFFLTIPFGLPWLPWLAAALAFTGWKVWTLRVQPSSRVVNLESKPVAELLPGDWFRPYGSAGPVAEVEALQLDRSGWLHVWVHGGRELTMAPDYPVRRVEIRN